MIDKFIKYIFGGISNTVLSYIIYCFLLLFFNYKISYIVSIFLSVIYIYNFNTKVVFKFSKNIKKKILFLLIILFQIFIGIYLLDIWINYFLIGKYFAPLLNIVFISPATFSLNLFISKNC